MILQCPSMRNGNFGPAASVCPQSLHCLSSSNPALMDICDRCLFTCANEMLEMAVHSKETRYCISTPLLLGFGFFAHTVYCLCVEEMKLVFRVVINMNIYHVLIPSQEKDLPSVSNPSFPVSKRKCTLSENNVILDNKEEF